MSLIDERQLHTSVFSYSIICSSGIPVYFYDILCWSFQIKNQNITQVSASKGNAYPPQHCKLCLEKNIRRETGFLCALCEIPLHCEGCWTQYHTLKVYESNVQIFILPLKFEKSLSPLDSAEPRVKVSSNP